MANPSLLLTTTVNRRKSLIHDRKQFLLYTKILIHHLEKSGEIILSNQAKAIVFTCIQRNRMGDPSFASLQEVAETLLKELVGEGHCQKAESFTRIYTQQRNQRLPSVKRGILSMPRRSQVEETFLC